MTPEQLEVLGNLACMAIEDPSALPVFEDALQETGFLKWSRAEVGQPPRGPSGLGAVIDRWSGFRLEIGTRLGEYTFDGEILPGQRLSGRRIELTTIAIAAVILCGGWTVERWPVNDDASDETDEQLRARLLGYWSPWAEGPSENDIVTATSAHLDELARVSYGMPRGGR